MLDFSSVQPSGFRQKLEKIAAITGRSGLTIVELEGGGWSADAPPDRENGENPILFIPIDPEDPTDPADPVNGIETPANIRPWDQVATDFGASGVDIPIGAEPPEDPSVDDLWINTEPDIDTYINELINGTQEAINLIGIEIDTITSSLSIAQTDIDDIQDDIGDIEGDILDLGIALDQQDTDLRLYVDEEVSSLDTSLSTDISDLATSVDDRFVAVDEDIDDVVTGAFLVSRSDKDEEGVFTTVELRRPDGTLAVHSELSGGESPQYTTRTTTEYEKDGETPKKTYQVNMIYDEDGDLVLEQIVE